jgi:peptide chain release factor 2
MFCSPSDVLDGELNEFMEAALAHRVSGGDALVDDLG